MKFIQTQNHKNQGKIRGFIKTSIWASCCWLLLQFIQVALDHKNKNEPEITLTQNENHRLKK
jgi:hypothetical protein